MIIQYTSKIRTYEFIRVWKCNSDGNFSIFTECPVESLVYLQIYECAFRKSVTCTHTHTREIQTDINIAVSVTERTLPNAVD